jgi:hypothetical protein
MLGLTSTIVVLLGKLHAGQIEYGWIPIKTGPNVKIIPRVEHNTPPSASYTVSFPPAVEEGLAWYFSFLYYCYDFPFLTLPVLTEE